MKRFPSWLRRRPSPSMIIGVIALIAALGGTATALQGKNSVRADDIAGNAVKTRSIAPKAVKAGKLAQASVDPFKTDLTKVAQLAGELTTTSNAPVDLAGSPSVTVKVPSGSLVAVFAEATMRMTGGGNQNEARVHLFEATSAANNPQILGTGSAMFDERFTAPGPGNQVGSGGDLRGGWLVFSAGSGTKTFTLRYSGLGGGTAIFQNPKLWVTVLN